MKPGKTKNSFAGVSKPKNFFPSVSVCETAGRMLGIRWGGGGSEGWKRLLDGPQLAAELNPLGKLGTLEKVSSLHTRAHAHARACTRPYIHTHVNTHLCQHTHVC